MTSEERQRAYELFEQALERPLRERSAFLDGACGHDAELRVEVESLLEHDSRVPDDFMQPPEADATLAPPATGGPLDPLIGSRVGGFHIKQVIASGGMGTVYEAEQERPRRIVALKIIKLGMDTDEVVARFESEREALAMMNHPNIAKVFDAGATEQGRPYFVMEHVPGVPVTEHCDRHKLDIEGRLKLFMRVCDAVQHAHQKGIIHRDLKPSNVLVAYEGQQAVPKIIDFGVAKALNQRLSERTVFTELGQVIGTPEYMSPEQAETSGQDIDTRADIYSLGVLLYELLTGTLPFDSETLRRAAFVEIQRIIREVEPEKPSTKLGSLSHEATKARSHEGQSEPEARARDSLGSKAPAAAAASLDQVARNRHSDPSTLLRDLRGDLDWIVMKCLEKDRARRYETASALAADVQRHLNHEPVVAGPPSAVYRVRKFVRRNRGPVLAAGLVTLSLLAGLIATTTFALREARQRQLAEDNEALALERAQQTLQVAEFQRKMLDDVNAKKMGQTILEALRKQVQDTLQRSWVAGEGGKMRKHTADEVAAALAQFDAAVAPVTLTDVARQMMDVSILAPAVSAVREEFADQPQIQAELLNTIGTVYASLGQYDLAERHLRQALEFWRRFHGDEHAAVATGLNNLAGVLYERGDYAGAQSLYREALALRRKLLGNEHADVATSLNTLGWLLYVRGDYDAAEPLYNEGLALRRKLFGPDHPEVATSLNNLALLKKARGEYDAAEPLFREALALRRKLLGDEHPRVAVSLNNLAALLKAKGDYTAAEPLYREALALFRKILGNEHPIVASTLNNLALLLEARGEYDAAEPLLREALALDRKLLGNEHPDMASSLNNLASLLRTKGDYAAAESLYREALALNRRVLGDEHSRVAQCLNNLALLLVDTGDYVGAEPLLLDALTLNRKLLGNEHLEVARNLHNLASLLRAKGDYAAAEPVLREALALKRKLLGDEHPDVALSLHNLAALLHAKNDCSAAEPLYRQALTIREKKLPSAHPRTTDSRIGLSRALTNLGRHGEAESLLVAAHEAYARTPSASVDYVRRNFEALIELYHAWHTVEPEGGCDAKAAEWRAKLEQWQATTQPATSQPAANQPASSNGGQSLAPCESLARPSAEQAGSAANLAAPVSMQSGGIQARTSEADHPPAREYVLFVGVGKWTARGGCGNDRHGLTRTLFGIRSRLTGSRRGCILQGSRQARGISEKQLLASLKSTLAWRAEAEEGTIDENAGAISPAPRAWGTSSDRPSDAGLRVCSAESPTGHVRCRTVAWHLACQAGTTESKEGTGYAQTGFYS